MSTARVNQTADEPGPAAGGKPIDRLGRGLRDLRISVTDRCNFRCRYCMPREVFGRDHNFLPRASLLSFEEIARVARLFARCGVRKLRVTGGEPLLRRQLERLIEQLAAIDGIEDIALTTNGALLDRARAEELRAAGLTRCTVSLDSLDAERFRRLTDVDCDPETVLAAIDNAAQAGLGPIKVNVVVHRGVNDDEILPLAERFRGTGHVLRFIELMDAGNHNGWRPDAVVSAAEVVRTIDSRYPLERLPPRYAGEVARRWRYADGAGEIGCIASVTQPFCGSCTRARISADGQLYTCLFASRGHDLRSALREDWDDAALMKLLGTIWGARTDRYSELRGRVSQQGPRVEMGYIGG